MLFRCFSETWSSDISPDLLQTVAVLGIPEPEDSLRIKRGFFFLAMINVLGAMRAGLFCRLRRGSSPRGGSPGHSPYPPQLPSIEGQEEEGLIWEPSKWDPRQVQHMAVLVHPIPTRHFIPHSWKTSFSRTQIKWRHQH